MSESEMFLGCDVIEYASVKLSHDQVMMQASHRFADMQYHTSYINMPSNVMLLVKAILHSIASGRLLGSCWAGVEDEFLSESGNH